MLMRFLLCSMLRTGSYLKLRFIPFALSVAFQVYLTEVTKDISVCAKRNIRGRTVDDLQRLHLQWESAPSWITRLDVSNLLQEADIQDVSFVFFTFSKFVEHASEESKDRKKSLQKY